jgi:hypothetical protein
MTTKNIYGSATQQWRSHQWAWTLNRHLEMVHTVSGYRVRFTVWSHRYIKPKKLNQNMDNIIFEILLKQQQNGLKTTKPRAYGQGNAMTGRDAATSIMNESII